MYTFLMLVCRVYILMLVEGMYTFLMLVCRVYILMLAYRVHVYISHNYCGGRVDIFHLSM